MVNGVAHSLLVDPSRTLVSVLRQELGLTGTHVSCEIGVCGVCTVLVNGAPVRACLFLAAQADGAEIRTVESLARSGAPSVLQASFSRAHALQCGFCTPGLLMLLTWYLESGGEPVEEQIRQVVSSNLCRCTGYQGIVDAVVLALSEYESGGETA
jgi:carbon-monoxide dehydrogenase small subunit